MRSPSTTRPWVLTRYGQPFTHLPEQNASPVGQVHVPAEQFEPPVQIVPHEPQFRLFVWRLAQMPLQSASPDGQLHVPFWQVVPPLQAL